MMNNKDKNVLLPLQPNGSFVPGNPRSFKSPPQPHMCVQVTVEKNQFETPCFINVMSWPKMGLPVRPEDPVPLYGGVKVPYRGPAVYEGNVFVLPLVFAVLVNPQVLQQSGKHAKNPKETTDLIEMVLNFVEAMNRDLKLSRKFAVLKDQDLVGELKDIWAQIQAKRDMEKSNCNYVPTMFCKRDQPCESIMITLVNTEHERDIEKDEEEQSQELALCSGVCQSSDKE